MRATEIIRGLLDLIDGIDQQERKIEADVTIAAQGDDVRRFKQIVDLEDKSDTPYVNSPDEKYSGIAAVTTDAGGGWQAPKHPADIKGEHPSLYPGKVYGAK